MKHVLLDHLVSPASGSRFKLEISLSQGDEIIEGLLVSEEGERYPIRNGIPRFVSSEEYEKYIRVSVEQALRESTSTVKISIVSVQPRNS